MDHSYHVRIRSKAKPLEQKKWKTVKERRKSRRSIHFNIELLHSFPSFTKIDHHKQAAFSRGKQVNKKIKILSALAINDTCLCAQIFCLWDQIRFFSPICCYWRDFITFPHAASPWFQGITWCRLGLWIDHDKFYTEEQKMTNLVLKCYLPRSSADRFHMTARLLFELRYCLGTSDRN